MGFGLGRLIISMPCRKILGAHQSPIRGIYTLRLASGFYCQVSIYGRCGGLKQHIYYLTFHVLSLTHFGWILNPGCQRLKSRCFPASPSSRGSTSERSDTRGTEVPLLPTVSLWPLSTSRGHSQLLANGLLRLSSNLIGCISSLQSLWQSISGAIESLSSQGFMGRPTESPS